MTESVVDAVLNQGFGEGEGTQTEVEEPVHPGDYVQEEEDLGSMSGQVAATEEIVDTGVEEEAGEEEDLQPSEMEQLRAEISQLQDLITSGNTTKQEEEELKDIFGEDEDIDLMSREGANLFAQKLLKLAKEQAYPMVAQEAERASSLQAYAQEFYGKNPGLVSHKDEVQKMGQKIVEANPDITPERLFSEVAKAANKRFGVQADSRRKPGFTKAGARSRAAGQKTTRTTQDDVLDLIG